MRTFDTEFRRGWTADITREPSEIRGFIAKQEGIQAACIRDALGMTADARKRLKKPLAQPFTALVGQRDLVPAFEKQITKFDAAAAEIRQLTAELAISEQARA